MRRVPALTAVLAILLAAPGLAVAGPSQLSESRSSPQTGDPAIVAVYPNPAIHGDAGEFVVLSVPPETDLSHYTLSDGEDTVPLPNVTASGRITVSTNATAIRPVLDRPVRDLPGDLRLANGGERITLRRDRTPVDTASYGRAPEAEVYECANDGESDGQWRPLGATDRPVATAGQGRVRAFVLPDGSGVVSDAISRAEERILLAGYTFTDGDVADRLVAAVDRNVTVRVLVEGTPVGGMTRRQARTLDRLDGAGVDVTVLGGDRARYRFHHAKYAVVDERAVVTTENWKPSGVGGNASRGWGVVTSQSEVAEALAGTFRIDVTALDARPWAALRADRSFHSARNPPANGSYPARFAPRSVPVNGTRLVVAPDNAEGELRSLLSNATESLDVQQMALGARNTPPVRATLDAARRGVEVRILLSSAWYVREDNQRLVDWLNDRADRENLPLEARLADPRGRFEKIHSKGVIVDGEQVLIGSINWNNNSLRNNREVGVVLSGQAVGDYYEEVFEADWLGGVQRLPVGLLVVLAVAVVVAAIRLRRISFEK